MENVYVHFVDGDDIEMPPGMTWLDVVPTASFPIVSQTDTTVDLSIRGGRLRIVFRDAEIELQFAYYDVDEEGYEGDRRPSGREEQGGEIVRYITERLEEICGMEATWTGG